MPTVRYKGFVVTCATAQEAAEVIARVQAEDAQVLQRHIAAGGVPPAIQQLATMARMLGIIETSYWTGEKFWRFVESVGEPQKRLLELLVRKHRVSADEMCKALELNTNQQLAGVLSGISKQAGAHDVPARAVFTIDNESRSGETTKTYVIAMDFLKMATGQNWPTA